MTNSMIAEGIRQRTYSTRHAHIKGLLSDRAVELLSDMEDLFLQTERGERCGERADRIFLEFDSLTKNLPERITCSECIYCRR